MSVCGPGTIGGISSVGGFLRDTNPYLHDEGPGTIGGMPSVRGFLRNTNPYLRDEGPGTIGGMVSMGEGVFLRDPYPYLHEFRRKSRKTPKG